MPPKQTVKITPKGRGVADPWRRADLWLRPTSLDAKKEGLKRIKRRGLAVEEPIVPEDAVFSLGFSYSRALIYWVGVTP